MLDKTGFRYPSLSYVHAQDSTHSLFWTPSFPPLHMYILCPLRKINPHPPLHMHINMYNQLDIHPLIACVQYAQYL